MTRYFDDLETRSADQRAAALAKALPDQIARAKALQGYAGALDGVTPAAITSVAALAALPVLRKSDLGRAQAAAAPFGGLTTRPASGFAHIFQSPGPSIMVGFSITVFNPSSFPRQTSSSEAYLVKE